MHRQQTTKKINSKLVMKSMMLKVLTLTTKRMPKNMLTKKVSKLKKVMHSELQELKQLLKVKRPLKLATKSMMLKA